MQLLKIIMKLLIIDIERHNTQRHGRTDGRTDGQTVSWQLMFSSLWFQTAHHHLTISDHALMTNFCWIKLHTLMNVNFSFACSIKTVI